MELGGQIVLTNWSFPGSIRYPTSKKKKEPRSDREKHLNSTQPPMNTHKHTHTSIHPNSQARQALLVIKAFKISRWNCLCFFPCLPSIGVWEKITLFWSEVPFPSATKETWKLKVPSDYYCLEGPFSEPHVHYAQDEATLLLYCNSFRCPRKCFEHDYHIILRLVSRWHPFIGRYTE